VSSSCATDLTTLLKATPGTTETQKHGFFGPEPHDSFQQLALACESNKCRPDDSSLVIVSVLTTRIKTPYGLTAPIPMDRGTIWGDSLSPFLFILCMEPLLRCIWLHNGKHGYTPGCMKGSQLPDDQRQTSSITYADDVNILTGSLRSLKHQANKLSAYTTCGHLVINHKKKTVTGALHHTQPNQPYDD
jgi:hypothetical protein